MAEDLIGLQGKVQSSLKFVKLDQNRVPKTEAQDGTDVRGGARKSLKGCAPFEQFLGCTILHKADILQGKEPYIIRGTDRAHHTVASCLNPTVAFFSRVLMVVVWL